MLSGCMGYRCVYIGSRGARGPARGTGECTVRRVSAYPKYYFTYPDVAALQKSLTVFDCQIFNCQASVISEINHKKLKLAFQMIHSLSHPECSDDEKSESTRQSNLNGLFIASQ